MKFLFLLSLIGCAIMAISQTGLTGQDTIVPKQSPARISDSSLKVIEAFRQKMDSGIRRVDSIIKSDTVPRHAFYARRH